MPSPVPEQHDAAVCRVRLAGPTKFHKARAPSLPSMPSSELHTRTKAAIVVIALTIAFATGCGHLGAAYAPAAPPANRGVVYVYRPSQHRGSALNLQVLIAGESQASSGGGTVVGMIENGGYVPVTALGKTRILFPYAKKSVDLKVEAGRSYYVRLAAAPSMIDPPEKGTLNVVDEAAAKAEIAETSIQDGTYRGN